MNKENLLKLINELNLPRDEYYILGGGSLVMYGLREKTSDIDLCVSTELFNELKQQYNLKDAEKNKYGFYQIDEITEVVPKDKKDFLYDVIDGYQVEQLVSILNFKKKRNLPKDQNDIKSIDDYLEKNKI